LIQRKTFSDERLEGFCCYCGGIPDTRDHVPSKVLLDEPFPENLPIVPCCFECNQDFSADEEYFACLIECVLNGSTDVEKLKRDKIIRILSKKSLLRKRITDAMSLDQGTTVFKIEENRVKNVIIKLAKGHAKFENSESQLTDPELVIFKPLHLMSDVEIESFFSEKEHDFLPEVGSRALQRIVLNANNAPISSWITVQENIYEYSFSHLISRISVKILIGNYLAIEAIWD
jgi:hypothetical protein